MSRNSQTHLDSMIEFSKVARASCPGIRATHKSELRPLEAHWSLRILNMYDVSKSNAHNLRCDADLPTVPFNSLALCSWPDNGHYVADLVASATRIILSGIPCGIEYQFNLNKFHLEMHVSGISIIEWIILRLVE